jgi:hypothetical protein
MLDRQSILNAIDLKPVEVEVPEWGGSVLIRGLNGKERDKFEQSMLKDLSTKEMNLENIRSRLVSLCMVDENGNHLMDEEELSTKSAVVLNRLFEVAQKLSGMQPEAVKEATKNLKNALKENSTSG